MVPLLEWTCTSLESLHDAYCCFGQTKPHPSSKRHKPSPEDEFSSGGWGGGRSKKPRTGLGSNPPLDWRKALDRLSACWSGPWSWRCQQKHANNTHTHNTHIVTQHTRTTHALSTLSPALGSCAACRREAGAREQGSEAQHLPVFGRRQTLTIN